MTFLLDPEVDPGAGMYGAHLFEGSSKELGKCCWPPSTHHPFKMSGFRKQATFIHKTTGLQGKHHPSGK